VRPLAVLVALCLAPAADACFLKCFSRQAPAGVPKPATVTIVSVDGKTVGPGLDPEVRAGVPVPVKVRCNFYPLGYSVCGVIDPSMPLATVSPTDDDISSGSGYYEFIYMLPALAARTTYKLRITVGMVGSEEVKFHTP
jgi:hypothetical protein